MPLQRSALILIVFAVAAAGYSAPQNAPALQSQTQPELKKPVAIIHTMIGDMKCQLFSEQAPLAVANFVGLATGKKDWINPKTHQVEHNRPLYDGTIFHRVIPDFMIQAGDPTGTGDGDPGYRFNDELKSDLQFDRPGRLAMANSGPNTNGSQFFITEKDLPRLNPCFSDGGCQRGTRMAPKGFGYTIFGQCDLTSVDLVKKIARMSADPRNNRPDFPVKILHIDILSAGKLVPLANPPAN
jgi:peptidyl-prolyl cis-trans isomerase A (cyclophilin A)